jgi:hypothetical protein
MTRLITCGIGGIGTEAEGSLSIKPRGKRELRTRCSVSVTRGGVTRGEGGEGAGSGSPEPLAYLASGCTDGVEC